MPSQIKLGFDTYSLRAFRWKALALIEFAAAQKLDTIQISSLDDYESHEPAYLQQVKDAADRAGMSLDGGIGCVCPTSKSWSAKNGEPGEYILKGLRIAKAIGATSMRCFMGAEVDRRENGPIERHIEKTVQVFRSIKSQAQDTGVKIAIENHSGDMQARETRRLIEEAGKDFVGACLDTGNPMWVVEDPQVTLEVLAPYTVTTHIRDSALYEHPRGAVAQWVPLGQGSVDFKKFVAAYRELCPQASMQLESITGRPPRVLPYLEPSFWKGLEKTNAMDFSRFVALAKSGHPFMGTMVVEDAPGPALPEFTAALREQQRKDLIIGLDYAKKTLDVGSRWRGL